MAKKIVLKTTLLPVREKPFAIMPNGKYGAVMTIPKSCRHRVDIEIGDLVYLYEDSEGRLVISKEKLRATLWPGKKN